MKYILRIAVGNAIIVMTLLGCTALAGGVTSKELTDTTIDMQLPRIGDSQSAELLSAFFGLDNTLPRTANRICLGGAGKDGMPVIFSTEIDHTTLQAGDFTVITQSGKTGSMHCVSLLPATDAGELRTVLLVGEFGNAETDPPARVEISGHIHSIDGALDFQGAEVAVTPLKPGPSLVLAELVTDLNPGKGLGRGPSRWSTTGSQCPSEGVVQAVRAVWAGGVTLENGEEPGEAERTLYRVTVQADDGRQREIAPVALADLGDGDNNHLLCLDTTDKPVLVSFPAGILTDPNDDLNPATEIKVSQ